MASPAEERTEFETNSEPEAPAPKAKPKAKKKVVAPARKLASVPAKAAATEPAPVKKTRKPRVTSASTDRASTIKRLHADAKANLKSVRQEITTRYKELNALHEDEAALARMVEGETGNEPKQESNKPLDALVGAATPAKLKPAKSTGKRTDWNAVLAKLNTNFESKHVKRILRSKPDSEIHAGVSRWIKQGLVAKLDRGKYTKVADAKGKAA